MTTAMQFKTMKVTPQLAAQWLEKNAGNRPVRRYWVDTMARSMRQGDFPLTHQPVALGTNGQLLDGQHRLMAVVKSGATVELPVAFNVAPETFAYIDGGIRRSKADAMRVPRKIQEVTNMLGEILFDRPTNAELQRIHDIVGATTQALVEHCSGNCKFFSSASIKTAAVTRIFAGDRKSYVLPLYRNLVMADLDALPPIGKAMVKQQLRGTLAGTNRSESLHRGLTVFNEKNAALTRVQVVDAALAYDSVRHVFKKII
jgi:hypothetical protein